MKVRPRAGLLLVTLARPVAAAQDPALLTSPPEQTETPTQTQTPPQTQAPTRTRTPTPSPRPHTQIFPLPMYTTVPNEGSTFGVMPVFLRLAGDAGIQSITAPSLSWNKSAGVNTTFRYYRYLEPLRSWRVIAAVATNINRSLWLQYDDERREPGRDTKNLVLRVRRNLFYRFFGLGPDSLQAGESSYTRLTGFTGFRWGWNFTRDINVGAYVEVRGDRPERHAISGLPLTQELYPDAPGLDGSVVARQTLSARYDTREGGDYAEIGFASAFDASLVEGLSGTPTFGQLTWTTRMLIPEASFLQTVARLYWTQIIGGDDVPFYDQASLGGELLLRGFPEDRFIDKGAWEVEAEQRIRLLRTQLFGVVSDWRIDPFVAAGQVYGNERPWSHVRFSAGAGLRVWVHPNVLGRIDVAYAGEGPRAYVVLGYPF